jgi:hypothetical protein
MLVFLLAGVRAVLVGGGRMLYDNRAAAAYALFFILAFALAYHFMGVKEHFDVPDYLQGREGSFLTSLYTSVLAQNNAMPDTTPKSNVARVLFMSQVTLGWLWFLVFNPRSVF